MTYTQGLWSVNGIDSKRNRIVGDETSAGWDKLQVNAANYTIATVYRSADARLISGAPDMYLALQDCLNALCKGGAMDETDLHAAEKARNALAKAGWWPKP